MPCLAVDQTRDESEYMKTQIERVHTSSKNGNVL